MAIPTGHIGRILAEQALRPHDDVLQNLVERMAHMQVAIGVRRAVVQDETLAPLARFAQRAVQILVLPAFQHCGLFLGEPCAHRKIGLRQEDAVFIICFFAHAGALVEHRCPGND